jgi:hypothetical protein
MAPTNLPWRPYAEMRGNPSMTYGVVEEVAKAINLSMMAWKKSSILSSLL